MLRNLNRVAVVLVCLFVASSIASAQLQLDLPDSGPIGPDPGLTNVFFDFPPNPDGTTEIASIQSISMDLNHTWASDVIITLAGPAGAAFVLANQPDGSNDLAGRYTFVPPGTTGTDLSNAPVTAGVLDPGTYDALTWSGPPTTGQGPFPKNGWVFTFEDDAFGDGGDFSNISIVYNKVPEPTSLTMLFAAICGLGILRRR